MGAHKILIEKQFEQALEEAHRQLSKLSVLRGRSVPMRGLSGWVFEQTIRTCLEEALRKRGLTFEVEEQASITGRATVDLRVGPAAIEIKVGGFYGDVSERYGAYREQIEGKGWHYFYLTLVETYEPYIKMARSVFGRNRAFFLDQSGEWHRFVDAVADVLQKHQTIRTRSTASASRRVASL